MGMESLEGTTRTKDAIMFHEWLLPTTQHQETYINKPWYLATCVRFDENVSWRFVVPIGAN
jgi:hypothetical protein